MNELYKQPLGDLISSTSGFSHDILADAVGAVKPYFPDVNNLSVNQLKELIPLTPGSGRVVYYLSRTLHQYQQVSAGSYI